jgi:hypothetical protein
MASGSSVTTRRRRKKKKQREREVRGISNSLLNISGSGFLERLYAQAGWQGPVSPRPKINKDGQLWQSSLLLASW